MGLRTTVAAATLLPLAASGIMAATSTASAAPHTRAHLAAPRPPRVTNLAPYLDGATVTLGWHNPDPALFRRDVVRLSPGATAPATPKSGTAVPLGRRRATTATLAALTRGHRYSAAVWVRDAMGRLSPRTATTFVVPRRAPHRTGTISGTVRDAHGAPLSGVTVRNLDSTAATVTDAAGKYRLEVPAGPALLEYSGVDAQGGHADTTGYVGDVRSVRAVAHRKVAIDVTLHAGAEITGRVVDDNGDPVAGILSYAMPATSYVSPDSGDTAFGVVALSFDTGDGVTGADGVFQLRGVPPTVVQTCFGSDGADFGWYSYSPFAPAVRCTDPPQELHADQLLDVGTTTITPVQSTGGGIAGRVVDRTGAGVARTAVFVARVGRREPAEYSLTDSRGRYEMDGLAAGDYRVCTDSTTVLSGSLLGYVSRCRTQHVTVVEGEVVRHIRVVVQDGGALSGVVRASDGTPVPGAEVLVGRGGYATTDATGHWSVGGLRSRRYRVCVSGEDLAVAGHPSGVLNRCTGRHPTLVVRRGRDRIGADLTLADAAAIRGTVVASPNHPIRGVEVEVEGGRPGVDDFAYAETGRHGHFIVRGMHAAEFRLCFYDDPLVGGQLSGCTRQPVKTRLGRVTNDGITDLGATGAVTATVDDSTGTPLNGVDVAVLKPCHTRFYCDSSPLVGQRFHVVASWVTEHDGTLRLPQIRPGNYRVCLFGYLAAPADGETPPTGYSDGCTSDAFDVKVDGNQDTSVTGTLAPAGAVTGTLTDNNGAPVPGVLVRITGSAADDVPNSLYEQSPFDDPALSSALTAADGSYTVRSVAPGDQTVCVRPDDQLPKKDFEQQCYGGEPGGTTGTPVPVTAGQVTSGIDLTVQRTG